MILTKYKFISKLSEMFSFLTKENKMKGIMDVVSRERDQSIPKLTSPTSHYGIKLSQNFPIFWYVRASMCIPRERRGSNFETKRYKEK